MIQRSFSASIYERNNLAQPLEINPDTLLDKHNSILLPDTLRTSVLLRRIALERSWSQDQVKNDLAILDEHRLYTVRDLLSLSDYSWKVIDLLPLVKDLLRSSVDPNWMNIDKKKLNKKQKNKKMQPISTTIGSPVYAGTFLDQTLSPTSTVLSSSPVSSSFNGDDVYIKPDESDPTFMDVICDDPLTIRNTLRNLSCTSPTFDDTLSPTTPSRSAGLKNVRFTDRTSIIMDDSLSSSSRRSPETDSTSSLDTVTTDEDEEALMTAAAAMVTGRSGAGRRFRDSININSSSSNSINSNNNNYSNNNSNNSNSNNNNSSSRSSNSNVSLALKGQFSSLPTTSYA
ncbi:uncharacterized protein BX664DRAFT_322525 [Halteromyces radiatus]|uniref:uncharacterized protein n=1 Tax=Halteromyces radiatus TaxID=101107 RepID=UPI00222043FE|nr:uncharacterized protein BX664DRAFT_322525 [Halteromyces radiatus]KAI8099965.1 hypothetical protein BX664DRAFT_322525 [Halteromyces radiatus]